MRRKNVAVVLGLIIIMLVIVTSAFAQNNGATDKRITLDLRDVSIQSAMKMLFQGTGLSYSMDQGVSGTVNVSLNDIPFSQALNTVLSGAGLTMRNEDGVYHIGLRKDDAPVVEDQPKLDIPETQITRKTVVEKIPIGYISVYDLLSALSGSSSNGNSGSSGGRSGGNSGSRSGGSSGSRSGGSSGSSRSGGSRGGGGR